MIWKINLLLFLDLILCVGLKEMIFNELFLVLLLRNLSKLFWIDEFFRLWDLRIELENFFCINS